MVNSSTWFKLRFETDDGSPYDLDLPDSGPCRIGSRATILLFKSRQGEHVVPISIYSHPMNRWTAINNRAALRNEAMSITSQLIMCVVVGIAGLMTMFYASHVYSIVPLFVAGGVWLLFRELAAWKLSLALRDAQNAVRFG